MWACGVMVSTSGFESDTPCENIGSHIKIYVQVKIVITKKFLHIFLIEIVAVFEHWKIQNWPTEQMRNTDFRMSHPVNRIIGRT